MRIHCARTRTCTPTEEVGPTGSSDAGPVAPAHALSLGWHQDASSLGSSVVPMPLLTQCPPLFLPLWHPLIWSCLTAVLSVLLLNFPLPSCQQKSGQRSYRRKHDLVCVRVSAPVEERWLCLCSCVSAPLGFTTPLRGGCILHDDF